MQRHKGGDILLMGSGTILTSMILSGLLLGYLADYWLDSRPLFMLVCAGLGAVGGFLRIYNLLSRIG